MNMNAIYVYNIFINIVKDSALVELNRKFAENKRRGLYNKSWFTFSHTRHYNYAVEMMEIKLEEVLQYKNL